MNALPESAPRSLSSLFEDLAASDQELTLTVATFRQACAELAAKNGDGEPIRRRLRSALLLTRGVHAWPK